MKLSQTAERFKDDVARIEEVLFLAGMVGDDHMSERVEEFLEDELDDLEKVLECKISQETIQAIEDREWDCFSELIYHKAKLGYLVKFATPIMERLGGGDMYSWGYYTTKWFYGDTMEEAMELGFKWVSEQREKGK